MPLPLLTIAEQVEMLEETGGVPLDFGASSTWGHFEEVPVERTDRDGFGVLTREPSVVIVRGAVPDAALALGSPVTVNLDNDEDGIYETAVGYTVRDRDVTDPDGGVLRVMLRAV